MQYFEYDVAYLVVMIPRAYVWLLVRVETVIYIRKLSRTSKMDICVKTTEKQTLCND